MLLTAADSCPEVAFAEVSRPEHSNVPDARFLFLILTIGVEEEPHANILPAIMT